MGERETPDVLPSTLGTLSDCRNYAKFLVGSSSSSYMALQLFIEFWPSQPTLSIFFYLGQGSSSLVLLSSVYLF